MNMQSKSILIIFLLLLFFSKMSLQWTSMAEYPMAGLSLSITSIPSSIDSGSQPILNFPSN